MSVVLRYREKGLVPAAIIDGREPVGDGEIALGLTTLRDLGKHLGDTVQLTAPELPGPMSMSIVGTAIIRASGQSAMEPGIGALVDGAVAGDAGAVPYLYNGPGGYIVRFDPEVDREAAVARLRTQFFAATHYPAIPPTVIGNFQRVSYLPGVLATVLTVLALGMLVHGLLTVVRRRRRELAVLKAMGFTGRQVTARTGWEATFVAAVALVIGIPVGIALGRAAWQLTARSLGVASRPVVPWLALGGVAVITVLVVNLAAAGPGWRARRIRAADALRAE
jgi:putative ABC transport system permease protein